MNKTIEGIILSIRDYKERDAILKVLCKDIGIQSFVARGLRKANSKNLGATQMFTHAKFFVDFHEGKTIHTMKTAEIIQSYRQLREDLLKQTITAVFCECIEKLDLDEMDIDAFSFLQNSMIQLSNTTQPYGLLALFFANMNRFCGVEPYVEGCVHCQSTKKIRAVSLLHGGFVCVNCADPTKDMVMSKQDLLCFRLLCLAQMEHFEYLESFQDWTFAHVNMIHRFFEEYSGIYCKSMRFLSHIAPLDEKIDHNDIV